MPWGKREQREYNLSYWHIHKEKLAVEKHEYYLAHKEIVINRNYVWQRKKIVALKEEIFALLGNQCANPFNLHEKPFTDLRCLQIDHVNGGGYKEMKQDKRNSSRQAYLRLVLSKIKSGKKEYQLLCANCNWIKVVENKEWNGTRRNGKVK